MQWSKIVTGRDGILQGWPDFFVHGPFSIILNVPGAASLLMLE
jgi:hypothetical protein